MASNDIHIAPGRAMNLDLHAWNDCSVYFFSLCKSVYNNYIYIHYINSHNTEENFWIMNRQLYYLELVTLQHKTPGAGFANRIP